MGTGKPASIRLSCVCGAHIRLPASAAGRKARCKACRRVLTVPGEPQGPDSPDIPAGSLPVAVGSAQAAAGEPQPEAGGRSPELVEGLDGLLLLAEAEEEPSSRSKRPSELVMAPDTPDILASPVQTPPRERLAENLRELDADRQGVRGPTRSFWADLLLSFGFLLETNNFINYISLVAMLIVPLLIPIPLFGLFIGPVLSAYSWAFLLSIIRETASGEDELPTVWINDAVDDVLFPLLHFAGSWLFVLIPAGTWVLCSSMVRDKVDWTVAAGLAVFGLFCWPAVVLAVSIGGTFRGLWPHLVIGTVLASPLAYLALWGTLIASVLLATIPFWTAFVTLAGRLPVQGWLGLEAIHVAMNVYCFIVAMRAIGLYYRHFRQRIPWAGE